MAQRAHGRIITLTRRTNTPNGNPRFTVVAMLKETGRTTLSTADDSQAALDIREYAPGGAHEGGLVRFTLDALNRVTRIDEI